MDETFSYFNAKSSSRPRKKTSPSAALAVSLSTSWMVALRWLILAESGPLSNSFLKASLMTAIPNEAPRSVIEGAWKLYGAWEQDAEKALSLAPHD